jgi:phage regulator Rha-like protein
MIIFLIIFQFIKRFFFLNNEINKKEYIMENEKNIKEEKQTIIDENEKNIKENIKEKNNENKLKEEEIFSFESKITIIGYHQK